MSFFFGSGVESVGFKISVSTIPLIKISAVHAIVFLLIHLIFCRNRFKILNGYSTFPLQTKNKVLTI